MISFKETRALKLALFALATAFVANPFVVNPAMADDTKSMVRNTVMLPVRAASVATGLAVGIPVAIMRRSGKNCVEYNESMADSIGGHKSLPPKFMAGVLSVPAGIIVGTGEGLYYGGKNAFSKSAEHPFSLATLSLDEEIE